MKGMDKNMKKYYETLTNQYPVQKTLRFRLEPIGKTSENIQMNHILDKDVQRKEDYVKVKRMIDKYHIKVINEALQGKRLDGLDEIAELFYLHKRDEKQEKALEDGFASLRKQIAGFLRSHEKFEILNKKELIENELPQMAKTEEECDALISFKGFTTYFTNFYAVRMNLYSDEKKSSTVAYRLIEENLPRFLDNINVYKKLREQNVDISNVQEVLDRYEIKNIDEVFIVDGFNYVLTQEGMDIYDFIVGELNKSINLHNQQEKTDNLHKTNKIPKMKILYKQILTDHEKAFVMDDFEDDVALLETLRKFAEEMQAFFAQDNEMGIYRMLGVLEDVSGQGIYVKNDVSLTTFSNIIYKKWNWFTEAISQKYDADYSGKKKLNTEKYDEEKAKNLKKVKSYSLYDLQALCSNMNEAEDIIDIKEKFCHHLRMDIEEIVENYEKYIVAISKYDTSKRLSKHTDGVGAIKSYLDAIKRLEADLKLLMGTGIETDRDFEFYGEYTIAYDHIREVDGLYNMVRNYLTRKPFSTEKTKLNFDKATFLDGWDKNKERDNLGIILEKGGLYYLGIINRSNTSVIESAPESRSDEFYNKMEYKLLPGPYRMLPKVFFSKSRIEEFSPSEELLNKYNAGTYKKGDNFSLKDCHELIDFFKESINKHEEWKNYGFKFSDTNAYKDISEFYNEVKNQGYKLDVKKIDADYLDKLVNNGDLYLFQIYSKDFSEYSKGNYNLHTIYWKMLFDERNLSNLVYVLNGGAEVFYRPASIMPEDRVVHKKDVALENKNKLNGKRTSTFNYDIVKDQRYTEDKFEFHVPITMNYTALGNSTSRDFNKVVNCALKTSENVHVIGIDRGERNLLYLTVVDPQGNIVEQFSLNSIESRIGVMVDYHDLLDTKEMQRDEARRSWSVIENIKDLKEGYMSQVVHAVARLVLKYNAVIAIEDLNMGFMRGRQKVEKQIYQKFEKMLIDKLNYLVMDKSRGQTDPYQIGGSLNALQLTSKFESFKLLGKQTGIIFYVPAWMTSKLDPTTGFVNLFYLKYENREKARDFWGKFDSIIYNAAQNYFEFTFDYHNFTYKADGSRTNWTICSKGERIVKYKDSESNHHFVDRVVEPTESLKTLFEQYHISYQSGEDVVEQICSIEEGSFYKELYSCLRLVLQIRNSSSDGKRDYLQSCVMNEKGDFYNSDNVGDNLPKDADANGAYNIARKGLWALQQIRETDEENLAKVKLAISNKEWLKYTQENRNG
ncbi:MAG: type V CRISPR-associated protein Cas12a/Cpf1 [Lachnoclostridium sp.]|nr:type V CRISPR-associated protein Cas12a/Cpf1 [Lachnospira sp.]MCM1247146.1 type V CRISPR-associated protein Cas12a/Cpf1 [Lachnoclostridium sp.]